MEHCTTAALAKAGTEYLRFSLIRLFKLDHSVVCWGSGLIEAVHVDSSP